MAITNTAVLPDIFPKKNKSGKYLASEGSARWIVFGVGNKNCARVGPSRAALLLLTTGREELTKGVY